MGGRLAISIVATLALGAGACTSTTGPQLSAGSAPVETSSAAKPSPVADPEPTGTTIMAKGTPTEVYELVARGALGCWFGAGGPLKTSHVFQAEAAPPAEGGAAEIVLHERDSSFRDQRGPRAFRVTFASAPMGAQVNIANIKMTSAVGGAMVKDVETWTGSGTGCQVRGLFPPAPAPAPEKAKAKAKGKSPPAKASRQP